MADPDLIGCSLLKSGYGSFSRNTQLGMSSTTEQCITLSEALETYVTQKGAGKPNRFEAAAQWACSYLVDACGTKTLAEYTRADALSYRDYLIAKGLVGSSVGRVISSIRAVFNFSISEYALELKNPFVGIYFDKSGGISKRLPIPIEDIRKVQHLCRTIDDDLRWLVALVSDTGMRLAEGAGLLKGDIILDVDIPHISLKPHTWRPLKTSWKPTRYTAGRGLSLGRSEALRVLSRQPLCLPPIQQKGHYQLQLSQCCIEQMAASVRALGMHNA
jgi:integrase